MKGLNNRMIIGNVVKDPEVQILEAIIKVARFSMATTENYKDEKGGNMTHTEWHSIILWRGLAVLAKNYVRKGSLIHVEGKNMTRKYVDKEGNTKYATEIIGDQIILLDKKEA